MKPLAAALLAAVVLCAPPARACGGLFCSQANTPVLPVAQTAENVLFAMERLPGDLYRLEAHVEVFYSGTADKFSWVLPVDALPELDTGSNIVFTALDELTRPTFVVRRRQEGTCADDAMGIAAGGSGSTPAFGGEARGGAPGVQVEFHGSVGPYDATVVRSDDGPRLKAWLAQNNYFLTDEGNRLIDVYVGEQKYFVALKLLSGRTVDAIQPIVLRFQGRGPCVPLRLTAIAALADLRVNLWMLAQHRVVPENYFEIRLNEARLDWLSPRPGGNYQDLLKSAANEAGGNAFAAEFVGPTSSLIDKVGAPDLAALRALFLRFPKLTRLATFISPEEMTIDPTFMENGSLPDVPSEHAAEAVLECGLRRHTACNAPMRLALPDGRIIRLEAPANGGWCNGQATPAMPAPLVRLPALEVGWQRDIDGEGAVRFDNRQEIAAALDAHNQAVKSKDGLGCALGAGHSSAPAVLLAALALLIARRHRQAARR
jgi:hypothetical protein